ncbi:HVO_A0114 family putative DNA-binding protein [Methylobacterium sp. A54F]
MSKDLNIEVGTSLREMGRRAIEAWHAAESGEVASAGETLIFADWETFQSTFSAARVTLLRHLADHGPAASINALATALGRPYRRVHDDVTALLAAGLLERDGTRLALTVREAVARITFGAAA